MIYKNIKEKILYGADLIDTFQEKESFEFYICGR